MKNTFLTKLKKGGRLPTIKEVAEYCRVCPRVVYKWKEEGLPKNFYSHVKLSRLLDGLGITFETLIGKDRENETKKNNK